MMKMKLSRKDQLLFKKKPLKNKRHWKNKKHLTKKNKKMQKDQKMKSQYLILSQPPPSLKYHHLILMKLSTMKLNPMKRQLKKSLRLTPNNYSFNNQNKCSQKPSPMSNLKTWADGSLLALAYHSPSSVAWSTCSQERKSKAWLFSLLMKSGRDTES